MNAFMVRESAPGDAAAIAEFNCRLARETEGLELDSETVLAGVRNAMAVAGRATYFVADSGGDVVGQLMLTREWSDWRNADMWWLQSVYVRADWRKRGVFRALLEEAERRARAEGVACLRLYVESHNLPAQEVYVRRGFGDTGYKVMQKDLIVR
jgi:GNAT superfamily N-acetyltransferase